VFTEQDLTKACGARGPAVVVIGGHKPFRAECNRPLRHKTDHHQQWNAKGHLVIEWKNLDDEPIVIVRTQR
jgi:hypothetical protein